MLKWFFFHLQHFYILIKHFLIPHPEKNQCKNTKRASSVKFWHSLADMLPAGYPQPQHLCDCQEYSEQPAWMVPIAADSVGFSSLLNSWSSISSFILASLFWRPNLFHKCWKALLFLSRHPSCPILETSYLKRGIDLTLTSKTCYSTGERIPVTKCLLTSINTSTKISMGPFVNVRHHFCLCAVCQVISTKLLFNFDSDVSLCMLIYISDLPRKYSSHCLTTHNVLV